MDKINSTLSERRAEREHETRVQDLAQRTLAMIQPTLHFQASLLRQLADLCEAAARNSEHLVADIADQARSESLAAQEQGQQPGRQQGQAGQPQQDYGRDRTAG